MNDLTTTIHTYLTTAPTSNFLQRPVAMLDHWQGSSNLLWRVNCAGEDAVVKLYLDAGQARGRRQFDGHQCFSPLGLAPQPLWFDRHPAGLARQVLVYRWAPGRPLDAPTDAPLVALAQTVAQVHGSDPTTVRRFCPNPLNLDYLWRVLQGGLGPLDAWLHAQQATLVQHQFTMLATQAQTLVEAALPLWQQIPPTPVHGDLKLENALDSFGQVLLLDWEMFGLGDPAYEVATFLQSIQAHLPADVADLWLESYRMRFDQPGLAQRIAVYQRLLPFQAVAYLLHGLRQQSPTELPLLRENQPFLVATLNLAFTQAANALQGEPNDLTQALESLLLRVLG
ncbi:MAG: aminoglycoside phosphotransferase family protein [Caldilineaceae bacterium]|nr:aminoglycoside phosphotransferase family protein [Caldilineaceae bacterium]